MRFSLFSKIIVAISVGWVLFFSFIHYLIWLIPLSVLVFCLGVLFILAAWRSYKTKNPAPFMEPVGMLLLVLIVALSPLRMASSYLRLFVEIDGYEDRIESILKEEKQCDRGCILDSISPLRVAFPWYGAADNWYGICYDETGLVENANILKRDYSNMSDPEYQKAAGLYDGGLRHVNHLWGHWYFCNFT